MILFNLFYDILLSQSSLLWLLHTICLFVCICSAFKTYISKTMGRVLIKLAGSVGIKLKPIFFFKFCKCHGQNKARSRSQIKIK